MKEAKKAIAGALAAFMFAASCTAVGVAAFAEGQGSAWRAGKGTSVTDSEELGGSAYITGFWMAEIGHITEKKSSLTV